MNKLFLSCYLMGISVISNGQGSEESKAFYARAISEINPKHVQWIKTKAADADISPRGISDLQAAAQNYLTASNLGAVDPNALVQMVLRASYLQTTEDLRFFAEKLKYFNTCKKLLRDYLQKLRNYDSKMRESFSRSQYDSIRNFSFSIQAGIIPPSNPNVNRPIVKKDSLETQTINQPINSTLVTKPVNPDEVKLLIKELEQKDSLIDQNSQQASLRMQTLMDKAQRSDSIASNLYKKFAEAGNTIIANLK